MYVLLFLPKFCTSIGACHNVSTVSILVIHIYRHGVV